MVCSQSIWNKRCNFCESFSRLVARLAHSFSNSVWPYNSNAGSETKQANASVGRIRWIMPGTYARDSARTRRGFKLQPDRKFTDRKRIRQNDQGQNNEE